MVWMFGVVWAADPSPGLLLPSAVPMDAGRGEVSVSAAQFGLSGFGSSDLLGSARFGIAPAERLWVEVGATRAMGDTTGDVWGGVAFARYNVFESPGFSVGPVLMGAFEAVERQSMLGGGLALEGGSRRIRGDLTLVGVGELPEQRWAPVPLLGEAGVTFVIGTEDRHRLRLGVAEIAPEISWRYETRHLFVEAGILGLPVVLGGQRIEVGIRF